MHTRRALPDDADAVGVLLAASYGAILAKHYPADLLDDVLASMIRPQPLLLSSGRFFVVADQGTALACGGWSLEEPGSGAVVAGLAHLRHMATHPDHTRRGLARGIVAACAAQASALGVARWRAFASLGSEPFYAALGLTRVESRDVAMGQARLPVTVMEGPLDSATENARRGRA